MMQLLCRSIKTFNLQHFYL